MICQADIRGLAFYLEPRGTKILFSPIDYFVERSLGAQARFASMTSLISFVDSDI
jgi:hypothetical protein